MPLIGSDFVRVQCSQAKHCSECGARIPAGEYALVSARGGKTRKIVCSEDCRLNFDERIWEQFARKNAGRRTTRHPGSVKFVVSQVPKCEGSPPHGRGPVRGDPGPGAPRHPGGCAK